MIKGNRVGLRAVERKDLPLLKGWRNIEKFRKNFREVNELNNANQNSWFDKIGKSRTEVMNELREQNIGTQVHYIPVHTQPYYRDNYGYKIGDYPDVENYYKKALSIPLFPKMDNKDIKYVSKKILNIVE